VVWIANPGKNGLSKVLPGAAAYLVHVLLAAGSRWLGWVLVDEDPYVTNDC
jgi:hypothetical protein